MYTSLVSGVFDWFIWSKINFVFLAYKNIYICIYAFRVSQVSVYSKQRLLLFKFNILLSISSKSGLEFHQDIFKGNSTRILTLIPQLMGLENLNKKQMKEKERKHNPWRRTKKTIRDPLNKFPNFLFMSILEDCQNVRHLEKK